AGRLDAHSQLVGDDVGKCRLPEPGWAAEQDVLDRLAPAAGRLQEDAEVVAHLFLPDVVAQGPGTEGPVELLVLVQRLRGHGPLTAVVRGGRHLPSAFRAAASASCGLGC